ncbi:MAG: hypothetical protein RLZZ488_1660 [Pseudomonadota bacterium]|jgi:CubicO group peptidase (beta-lactamase class C family)
MDIGLPYSALIESLENEVGQGTFTAWSFAHQGGAISAFYADEAAPREWLVDQNAALHPHQQQALYWMPAFDLASLTKPLLANAWLRHCLGADAVFWQQSPLSSLIEARSAEGDLLKKWSEKQPRLTLAHLLNHTSGLPAWRWFGRALWKIPEGSRRAASRLPELQSDSSGEEARGAQFELTSAILSLPHTLPAGDAQTTYSDLNYYLLARVIENLSVQSFRGWESVIADLNALWGTHFWHASLDPERSQQAIPYFPYVNSQVVAHVYENRKLNNHAGEFGSVHDTNANILATDFRASCATHPLVSSHAGLFGSVLDVAKTVGFFQSTQNDLQAISLPRHCQSERFHWGLDTPSGLSSTAGISQWPLKDGRRVFGHLGYAGTSFWLENEGQYHILLTNRTAHRTSIGSVGVPRVLIFQKDNSSEPQCWIRRQQNAGEQGRPTAWQSVPWQDAYTLCFEHSRMITRYWNRNILRRPPDLANIRRTAGQLLWSV